MDSVHARGAFGGHWDYRHSDWDSAAGAEQGAGGGEQDGLFEQHPTAWDGRADVLQQQSWMVPTAAGPADGTSTTQYPDDWLYWQLNRNLDDSPVARMLAARGDQFRRLLECPADTFDGRKAYPGALKTEGSYMFSYSMNAALAKNVKSFSARTKISQWHSPSRRIMLTENWEGLPRAAGWEYAVPIARRHGVGPFHHNVPGDLAMQPGSPSGIRASAVFFGHVDNVDQDFTYNFFQDQPDAY